MNRIQSFYFSIKVVATKTGFRLLNNRTGKEVIVPQKDITFVTTAEQGLEGYLRRLHVLTTVAKPQTPEAIKVVEKAKEVAKCLDIHCYSYQALLNEALPFRPGLQM